MMTPPSAPRSQTSFEHSVVCILNPAGETVGAGFLAGQRLVLTCAHVVELARENPKDPVRLRFASSTQTFTAQVDPHSWRDRSGDDIALLRLEQAAPAGIRPLALSDCPTGPERPFRTFGHPQPGSFSGSGQMLGLAVVEGKRLLQLRSPEVTPGFSGAPVWDVQLARVIGMVTAITPPDDFGRLGTTALATPAAALHAACPEIKLAS
jgi:S1-C subfamily serine protease